MATFVRVLFVLALTWGSLASQFVLPPSAAASEIRLRTTQFQQILDADKADQANQAQKPSQAEIDAVNLRLTQLRAIDADSSEGQAQLKSVIDDTNTLAYIRKAAFYLLVEAEARQIQQIDASTPAGQTELLQVFQDAETPSNIRMAVMDHLSKAGVRSEAVQKAVLQLIRPDADKFFCQHAISSLPALGVPADVAVPALLPMLDDRRNCSLRGCSSGEISCTAARVLGEYGPAAADAIPRLAWEIDPANNQWHDHESAQFALGHIAPDQYPFFAQGAAAIQPLVRELTSPIHGRRRRAAERLLELREHATPAATALETALRDENLHVRATAAAALLATTPHPEATRVLGQLAAAEDAADRAKFVFWLDNYQLNFDDVEILRGLLSDPAPHIRSAAATRLSKTDRHAAEAFDAMVALYKKGGTENQIPALQALSRFPPERLLNEKPLVEEAITQPGTVGFLAKRLQRKLASAAKNNDPAK